MNSLNEIQNINVTIIPSCNLKNHHEIHLSFTTNEARYMAVETFNGDTECPRNQQVVFDELSFAITRMLKRCFKI